MVKKVYSEDDTKVKWQDQKKTARLEGAAAPTPAKIIHSSSSRKPTVLNLVSLKDPLMKQRYAWGAFVEDLEPMIF